MLSLLVIPHVLLGMESLVTVLAGIFPLLWLAMCPLVAGEVSLSAK